MMVSGTGWILFCLFLLGERTAIDGGEVQCSLSPAGALHPVRGLLERFEAGPGCAARESGEKETHVIAVGRATRSPDKQVTVLLRPLSLSRPPHQTLILVLSSKQPVSWWLEAERLPPDLPVLVQVSPNSTVQPYSLAVRVQPVPSLPFRPRALLRWALHRHGSLSSLTHTASANRVYVRVGEDTTMPSVCQLQSLFLSHNYLTSDLQPQEVQGCAPVGGGDPEVHVIKLHSAGSGLCGSLQVEVTVSLVPPVANAGWHKLVLILSSAVPVNWALTVPGLRGHISVYSSNSVSPLYPPEPDLTLTSMLTSDLSTTHDLLSWANQSGFPKVASYTEADLANRFVIRLAGGGTEGGPPVRMLGSRPPWVQERRLRQWLSGGGGMASWGWEAISVQCHDGRLNVAVDRHVLQTLSLPVSEVTLQDPQCLAQSNSSHFLLAFPVISCGTEGLLQGEPRGVQYKNAVLLWRNKPLVAVGNETDKDPTEWTPLVIHFSCLAAVPSAPSLPVEQPALQGPGPLPRARARAGPLVSLQLFVTEGYEQRQTGPCAITADNHVYVELSAKGAIGGGVDVRSCIVSPLSDPRVSPGWSVIRDGCSTDSSLTLSKMTHDQEDEEEEEDDEEYYEEEEEVPRGLSFRHPGRAWRNKAGLATGLRQREHGGKRGRGGRAKRKESDGGEEDQINRLRFSFVLRPIYNNSVQFLHCSIRLCGPESVTPTAMTQSGCPNPWGLRIPALVSKLPSQQCEYRNLSRPMLVNQPVGAARQLAPPAGQRGQMPSVVQLPKPTPAHSSSGVETGSVLGIVFVAFLMGISLMGALWCIYSHTGAPPPTRRGSLLENTNPALLDSSNSSV
ncbi:transforming growth factor beta receptor type 3 isoform X1 [Coregonus clupeaformis]|uniref:transforming growth factor beta receptor type 3 isoform X1 n=1 Tax=Coregonus clupeaformis TaxID=59861 RepID=UPI001E1C5F4F|nr:transforming growth factor beta receptor type 3 isoform X1 [Coregonus clupeaformis]XP_041736337.2 transforming growth factor beta receptor type 3 isoform X1 [Coregonus clupeaformis]XP_041736338.2 transforming growth factor beta receptor type 3 isoform X1 [Coregonus clupeaformis]